jgi:hypothetical protein
MTPMTPHHLRVFSAPTFSRRTAPVASIAADRWALGRIQHAVASARVRLVLWDGFDLPPAHGAPGALNPWIRKRIFPGAHIPTLPEVVEGILEPWDFSALDVENLRLHYAATLDHWRRRFEGAAGEVAEMFDETFVRAWRLYLAGSQAAFTTGSMQLFQIVFARGSSNAIPWTRGT